MGAALAPLLFPVPSRQRYNLRELKSNKDLRWVSTRSYGETPALYFKQPRAKYTLLYTHGNAEDLGEVMYMLPSMASKCEASIFAVEYPGYSISAAEAPCEDACYEAVEAAWQHLIEREQVDPRHIVPFGRSLGSGPAVHLASIQQEPPGLVLQSPLESGARAVMNKYIGYIGYFVDPFKNYMKVDTIEAKTCIIHGTADKVVPCNNGEGLYAALHARGKAVPPLWIEGRGHNDMPPERVFDRVKQFLTTELDQQ
mmetsp:Transcript_23411/g.43072  ORF Transcript_23411/g.43072 Transcript_23411/m.43072 type:complete len:255 (+) Transcript_23411:74-838(+)